jgi:TonB family protein
MIRKILERWYSIIPYAAQSPSRKDGTVIIHFTLLPDGAVAGGKISSGSGDPTLDAAALRSVTQANPFSKLPEAFKTDQFEFKLQFLYNPKSGDGTSILHYPIR